MGFLYWRGFLFPTIIQISVCFISLVSLYSENSRTLIGVMGILTTLAFIIMSVRKLIAKDYCGFIQYGMAVVVIYVSLSRTVAVPMVHLRHDYEFSKNRDLYLSEVRSIKKEGIKYREWKWSSDTNVHNAFTLVYDESGNTLARENHTPPCDTSIYSVDKNFFVVTEFCP